MKRTNKYISLLALAAALIACNKVTVETNPDGNYRIAFDEVGVDTKGHKGHYTSGNIATEDNDFVVYGYYTTDAAGYNADASDFVPFSQNPRIVTYSASTTPNWTYPGEPEYWQDGGAYRFMAYCPAEFPAKISGEFPSNTFTDLSIPSLRSEQIDILAASAQRKTSEIFNAQGEADNTSVSFTFKHLLSNICIKLEVEAGFEVTVNTVVLNNVTRTADCTYNSDGIVWSNHSGLNLVGDNTISCRLINDPDDPDDPDDNAEFERTEDYFGGEGVLVIPQMLSEDSRVQLVVVGDVKNLSTGDIVTGKRFENVIPITGEGVPSEWLPGNKYTYFATLSVDYSISFGTPSVEKWKEEPMGGTVVIL